MHVNFYATLRAIVGTKTVEFPVSEGSTVQQLLEEVIERYPALYGELFDDNGDLYRHVHVFVNGRDVPFLDDTMGTRLRLKDTIDIFPAVAGG